MKNHPTLGTPLTKRRREQTKSVSPRQYLNLSLAEKGQIERARIVAPKLGDGARFGQIEVTYK